MRLLHTKRLTIETPTGVRPYAILSHRWLADHEEISFQDLQHTQAPPSEGPHNNYTEATFPSNVRSKQGFAKFLGACDNASRAGLEYIWIDTCCIDKTSSAELSEAINSMYAWYQDSAVCYVYLHDVDDNGDLRSTLEKADWFKRGWTLQELIAPENVYFFNKDWMKIGSKATWARILSKLTHIREDVLLGNPCTPSIAEKMSWAAGRKTKKTEDRAYSLMGLFGIHMPIIYGEGEKAFRRLQLEIMKSSDDQTIFAWHDSLTHPHPVRDRGLLASAPDVFSRGASPIVTIDHSNFIKSVLCNPNQFRDMQRGYSILNDGIHITLPMKQVGVDVWLAVLRCKREDQNFPYGIFLKKRLDCHDFLRTSPTKLRKLESADLEGLRPLTIRIAVDHHILPAIGRRQFFTFQLTYTSWEPCGYYVCPKPGSCHDHDVARVVGYQVLNPNDRIELSDNVQCGCIYWQGLGGKVTVLLIGIEHRRPWVHLLTHVDLHQYVDTSQLFCQTIYDAPSSVVLSPTSIQHSDKADWDQLSPLEISPVTSLRSSPIPPSRSQSLSHTSTGTHNRFPQRHFSTSHVTQLRGGGTGCPVCSIIQHYPINMKDIKSRRVDFVTERMSDKQIEVDIRKGQVHVSESDATLEVDYVISVTMS